MTTTILILIILVSILLVGGVATNLYFYSRRTLKAGSQEHTPRRRHTALLHDILFK